MQHFAINSFGMYNARILCHPLQEQFDVNIPRMGVITGIELCREVGERWGFL